MAFINFLFFLGVAVACVFAVPAEEQQERAKKDVLLSTGTYPLYSDIYTGDGRYIPSAYSAGIVPTGYSAGILRTGYSAGYIPTRYSARYIPSAYSAGYIPTGYSAGIIPSAYHTGYRSIVY